MTAARLGGGMSAVERPRGVVLRITDMETGESVDADEMRAFQSALDLGLAWQEAEAALPEGWELQTYRDRRVGPLRYMVTGHDWSDNEGCRRDIEAEARTLAEALRNLAAKLVEPA